MSLTVQIRTTVATCHISHYIKSNVIITANCIYCVLKKIKLPERQHFVLFEINGLKWLIESDKYHQDLFFNPISTIMCWVTEKDVWASLADIIIRTAAMLEDKQSAKSEQSLGFTVTCTCKMYTFTEFKTKNRPSPRYRQFRQMLRAQSIKEELQM